VLRDRLALMYDAVGPRDVVEMAILAVVIYGVLRFLGKTRGAGMVRGLGLVVVGLFLVAQVLVACFDLTVLGKVLEYLHTIVVLALLVIFQPELRRGLILLGRYRVMRFFIRPEHHPVADELALAAESLSRERVGALIVVQRQMALDPYAETGEPIDADVSAPLLRTLFTPQSPLHDGAVIVQNGRLRAAACQLPLGPPPDRANRHLGMRHRAALGMSDETDAVLLVVSEETGRISLAVAGKLEPVRREDLARRLDDLLNYAAPTEIRRAA
jgi:diadenylate cyclase